MAKATIVYLNGERQPVICNAFDEMKASEHAQKEGWGSQAQDLRPIYYMYYYHLRSLKKINVSFDQWARTVETLDTYPEESKDDDDMGEPSNTPDGGREV